MKFAGYWDSTGGYDLVKIANVVDISRKARGLGKVSRHTLYIGRHENEL